MVSGSFAICVSNVGHIDKLTVGETYQVKSRPNWKQVRLRHSRTIFPIDLFVDSRNYAKEYEPDEEVRLLFTSKDLPGKISEKDYSRGTIGRVVNQSVNKCFTLVDFNGSHYEVPSGCIIPVNKTVTLTMESLISRLEREIK